MMLKKSLLIGIPILLIFSGWVLPKLVAANQTFFLPPVQTQTATTTANYLTVGTATTTLTLNSYSYSPLAVDEATLLVRFAASSSNAILGINIEYSRDGIDWYKDGLNSFSATTSPAVSLLASTNSYSWTFASSTVGGVAATPLTALTATTTRAIPVKTPTRYVRAIFSLTSAVAGQLGADIYAEFVPRIQVSQ